MCNVAAIHWTGAEHKLVCLELTAVKEWANTFLFDTLCNLMISLLGFQAGYLTIFILHFGLHKQPSVESLACVLTFDS